MVTQTRPTCVRLSLDVVADTEASWSLADVCRDDRGSANSSAPYPLHRDLPHATGRDPRRVGCRRRRVCPGLFSAGAATTPTTTTRAQSTTAPPAPTMPAPH